VGQCPTWWSPCWIYVAPSVQRCKVWLAPTALVPRSKLGRPLYFAVVVSFFLWPLHVIGQVTIFLPCGFDLSFFFFPRLISAVGDWMSTILPHMVWPYCKFRMHVWNCCALLGENTARKKSPKIAICAPSHNFVGLYLRNEGIYRQSEKTC